MSVASMQKHFDRQFQRGLRERGTTKTFRHAVVALLKSNEIIETYMKDAGPCEHDVNVCVCGLIAQLNANLDTIAEIKKHLPRARTSGNSDTPKGRKA